MSNTNIDLIRERVVATLEDCTGHKLMTEKEFKNFCDDIELTLNLNAIEECEATDWQEAWHMGYPVTDESDPFDTFDRNQE